MTLQRETIPILQSEEFVTMTMALTPVEHRLMQHIRRLIREQCRGCLVLFEAETFIVDKLADRRRM